jgi:SAM-dependent methyltransferase
MSDALGDIADLYSGSLAEHGAEAKGVGWGDETSHKVRFDRLLRCMDEEVPARPTFNDLGCGYGALYAYLVEHGVTPGGYRGHDISEAMLGEARKRVTAPEAVFVATATLDKPADYSIASGIFNVRFERTDEEWLAVILETLRNMNAFSARGFSFNLLTTYADYRREHLYYGDPCFFFDHCKREFSKRVALHHDTQLFEWTVTVLK